MLPLAGDLDGVLETGTLLSATVDPLVFGLLFVDLGGDVDTLLVDDILIELLLECLDLVLMNNLVRILVVDQLELLFWITMTFYLIEIGDLIVIIVVLLSKHLEGDSFKTVDLKPGGLAPLIKGLNLDGGELFE